MKTKHTPGPWHIGMRPGPIVYGPKGEQVADLSADLLPKSERRANAHLINAAPDMYAVLLDLAQLAAGEFEDESEINGADFLDWFSEYRPAILAAVAKVQRGQS